MAQGIHLPAGGASSRRTGDKNTRPYFDALFFVSTRRAARELGKMSQGPIPPKTLARPSVAGFTVLSHLRGSSETKKNVTRW